MRDVTGSNAPIGANAPVLPDFVVVPDPPAVSFTCPTCGATSHHPADAAAGYCARCHDWTGERPGRMGPVCSVDDGRAGEGMAHESCAAAQVFADGDAWLFLGRTLVLEEMPG